MSLRKPIYIILVGTAMTMFLSVTSSAATTCTFTPSKNNLLLNGNCTTDATILIPAGKTIDGRGFTVTGVDPVGGHFLGAVLLNGGSTASVKNITVTVSGLANVCDGGANRLRGIMFEEASGSITGSSVLSINQGASGCQEGNAIEIRNFGTSPTSVVTVDGNTITGYQKTGIVANGNVNVTISNNLVDGGVPVGYIARNGIQFGFGGTGSARKNTVNGNSYTGSSTSSGGILVVGGPGYGGDFCFNIQIVQNTLSTNDIGIYLSQYEADFSAPALATNIKVVNNDISHDAVTNGYVYQAGVSDVGNGDKIINNTISGIGYDPTTIPGATFDVDADISFTNHPHVHANR